MLSTFFIYLVTCSSLEEPPPEVQIQWTLREYICWQEYLKVGNGVSLILHSLKITLFLYLYFVRYFIMLSL